MDEDFRVRSAQNNIYWAQSVAKHMTTDADDAGTVNAVVTQVLLARMIDELETLRASVESLEN